MSNNNGAEQMYQHINYTIHSEHDENLHHKDGSTYSQAELIKEIRLEPRNWIDDEVSFSWLAVATDEELLQCFLSIVEQSETLKLTTKRY